MLTFMNKKAVTSSLKILCNSLGITFDSSPFLTIKVLRAVLRLPAHSVRLKKRVLKKRDQFFIGARFYSSFFNNSGKSVFIREISSLSYSLPLSKRANEYRSLI